MSTVISPPSRDIPRITLGVLFIGVMIVASIWVLWPFLAATVWAATIVVATWSPMLTLQSRLGGRRGLAAAVMTGAMLLLLLVPLALAVSTIVDYADDLATYVANALSDHHVNIVACSTHTGNDRVAKMRFEFEMADPSHLEAVLRTIKTIDAVYDAYRLVPGRAS